MKSPVVDGPRGLHFPTGSLGVSASEQQVIHNRWNTVEAVENDLLSRGLAAPLPPQYAYPGTVTPAQLTTNDNQAYSTLYAQHLGWYNFVAVTFARVKAVLLQIENEMDDIAVRIRKDLRGTNKRTPRDERLSEQDISDNIASDVRYRDLTLDKQQYEQKKLEYSAYLDSMDRNLAVISRQVEIRRLEHEGGKTEGALPNRGYVRAPGR